MDERERLIEIMKSEGLNSKQFAISLGVSPGTISNIINGRNKPSLEFLQNIKKFYPTINSAWLFNNEGEMYIDGYEVTRENRSPDLFSSLIVSEEPSTSIVSTINTTANQQKSIDVTPRFVQKVVIFYSDGTFEER